MQKLKDEKNKGVSVHVYIHTHTHHLLDDLVHFRTPVDSGEGVLIVICIHSSRQETKMNIGFDAANPWPYKDLIMEGALLSDCISPPRHIAPSLLFIWEGTKEVCVAQRGRGWKKQGKG